MSQTHSCHTLNYSQCEMYELYNNVAILYTTSAETIRKSVAPLFVSTPDMCVNVVKLDGNSNDENKTDVFVEYYSNGEHSETKPEALKNQLEHYGNGMLHGVALIYSDIQCGERADKYAAFIGTTDIKTLPSKTYQTAE